MARRCPGCMNITAQPVCEKCGTPVNYRNAVHQLPVGTLLRGQYTVGKALGQGGFGITYIGWDNYLDLAVAIKEYYPNTLVNRDCTQNLSVRCVTGQVNGQYQSSRDRFLREAKALARFENVPAIVKVKTFFPENNTAYIIMEYVKGVDLAKYIQRRGGRLGVDETFRLLMPVMSALEAVHNAQMVHRDISPDNIILHPAEGAKLLDFGAVRSVENPDAERALTRATEAILKHGFAPLEQYQARGSLGPWTDVYALCATIYYCLTGRVPMDATERVVADKDLSWEAIPGLNPGQCAALRKGMALRAQDRYASMGQLRQALLEAESQSVPPAGKDSAHDGASAAGQTKPAVPGPSGVSQINPSGYSPSGVSQIKPSGYSPSGVSQIKPSGYSPSGVSQINPSGYSPSGVSQMSPSGYGPSGFQRPQPSQNGGVKPSGTLYNSGAQKTPYVNAQEQQKAQFADIVPGLTVRHKAFGEGIVKTVEEDLITIDFGGRERKYQFPLAFLQGFLSRN